MRGERIEETSSITWGKGRTDVARKFGGKDECQCGQARIRHDVAKPLHPERLRKFYGFGSREQRPCQMHSKLIVHRIWTGVHLSRIAICSSTLIVVGKMVMLCRHSKEDSSRSPERAATPARVATTRAAVEVAAAVVTRYRQPM
jgi:hypothetical protein